MKKRKHYACHNCSCHINPPCIECIRCNHYDVTEGCEHDCQDCNGHRD